MKSYTSHELYKMAEAAGWVLHTVRGSHHTFKHPVLKGRVTIPHPRKDMSIGTVQNILKQIKGHSR